MVNQPLDKGTRLYYYADLPGLLRADTDKASHSHCDDGNKVHSGAFMPMLPPSPQSNRALLNPLKRHRHLDKTSVRDVIDLHGRLLHAANPAVMARAIRSAAWLTVHLDPGIIEQVFRHTDCLACLLGKIENLPRSQGSGIHPIAVADVLSIDFIPVKPQGVGGWIGY